MKKVHRLLVASLLLGLVSIVLFVFERLALTDIFHGETDLTLEWSIVSISFLPILLFHLVSVVATVVALRHLGDRVNAS